MSLTGRITLAGVVSAAALFASRAALADIAVGDSGESHQSVWRVSDVGLYLDKSLAALPDVRESFAMALDTWSGADPRLPRLWPMFGAADAVGYRQGQSNRNTVRFLANGEPDAKGALAITRVSCDAEKHTIMDADIVVNGTYEFANLRQQDGQPGPGGARAYDASDMLAHELGHFFGLADNFDDRGAIMYPYFDPNKTRSLTPSDGDIQALDNLYSVSSGPPVKSSSCAMAAWGHAQGSSGCLIASSLILGLIRHRRRALQSCMSSNVCRVA